MAEVNQQVALGIRPPDPDNIYKTAQMIQNSQLAQARTDEVRLTALKQYRTNQGIANFQATGDINELIKAGVPEVAAQIYEANTKQQEARQRFLSSAATQAQALPPENRYAFTVAKAAEARHSGLINGLEHAQFSQNIDAATRGGTYPQGLDPYLNSWTQAGESASVVNQQTSGLVKRTTLEKEATGPYDQAQKAADNAGKVAAENGKTAREISEIQSAVYSETLRQLGISSGRSAAPSAASPSAIPSAGGSAPDTTPSPSAPAYTGKATDDTGKFTPQFAEHMKNLETRYNIPSGYLPTSYMLEQTGKSKLSSADKAWQFIDSTGKAYGLNPQSDDYARADAAARYAATNKQNMERILKRPVTDAGELYLGHQQDGPNAARLIQNPSARAGDIPRARDKAISNNGGDPNMTAGDFVQKQADRWNSFYSKYGAGQNNALSRNAAGSGGATVPIYPSSGAASGPLATNPWDRGDEHRQQVLDTAPGYSPQARQFMDVVGKDTGSKYLADSQKYSASNMSLQRLGSIDHNIEALGPAWMGSEADKKLHAARFWNSMIDTLAGPAADKLKWDQSKVAAGEELTKDTIRSGFEFLTSSMGLSREAASVVKMSAAAVPSIVNSYFGAKYISAGIRAGIEYQRGQFEYKANLVKMARQGVISKDQLVESLSTADADYAQDHPPEKAYRDSLLRIIPRGAKDQLRDLAGPSVSAAKRNAEITKFNNSFFPGAAEYVFQQDKESTGK